MKSVVLKAKPNLSDLRTQQKQQRREAVLKAADYLFRRHGYSKTNMEDVAEKAGVGVASVYNYFGTKVELLRALFEPELKRISEEADELLRNPPVDPAEGIAAMSACFQAGPGWLNRGLLEPFATDYFLPRSSRPNAIQDIDDLMSKYFGALMTHYKQVGQLGADVDVDDAVFLLSGLFALHLREFFVNRHLSAPDIFARHQRRLRLLFL